MNDKQEAGLCMILTIMVMVLAFSGLYWKVTDCYDKSVDLQNLDCEEFKAAMENHGGVNYRVPSQPFDACGYMPPATAGTYYTLHCTEYGQNEYGGFTIK